MAAAPPNTAPAKSGVVRRVATKRLALGSGEAAQAFAVSRRHLRSAQVRAEGRIRAIWRAAANSIVSLVREAESVSMPEGPIAANTQAAIRVAALAVVNLAGRKTATAFRAGLESAARREVKLQIRELARLGYVGTTELSDTVSSVVDVVIQQPFPGTTLTISDRLIRNLQRALRLIDQVIQARSKRARERAMANLRVSLLGGSGRYPEGGVLARNLSRINRTEQARAARLATLAVYDSYGVETAYWRLSSAHPWYGGGEICEVLAATTGDGVVSALNRSGVDADAVDIDGLYLVSDYPEIPHPNCMCCLTPGPKNSF